ncbi:DUF1284 domain-containing protein [Labrenzia sp. 011]|uniref:DUF1284 domain-containing protein n=1 Tax=Labrenzia sp. 011 TaxID=2171494 RepID=UPI000D50EEFA|nr:DUF1284 domain-containing protein [Labrenzia sp. 011]PVB63800.1 DUF1284 domain-containing protein [Labrenzia sp. 011]
MTVSLRPHHLLCLLTYLGKGYTANFVRNYDRIVRRLNSGEALRLVSGPDDICRPMLKETTCHCRRSSVVERDRLAVDEISAVLGCKLETGGRLSLSSAQICSLREAFRAGSIRSACAGCEWQELCSDIARTGFRDCRLSACPTDNGAAARQIKSGQPQM